MDCRQQRGIQFQTAENDATFVMNDEGHNPGKGGGIPGRAILAGQWEGRRGSITEGQIIEYQDLVIGEMQKTCGLEKNSAWRTTRGGAGGVGFFFGFCPRGSAVRASPGLWRR